jgi:hypothetical protein
MIERKILPAFLLLLLSACFAAGQDASPAATASQEPVASAAPAIAPPSATQTSQVIPLRVEKGTPLQIALDQEVRIHKAGQPIHGKIVQPVYAYDQVVVPEGAEVEGQIIKVGDISGGRRTLSALNAEFTPDHAIEVEFTTVVLGDGKRIPVHTVVTPGSGLVMDFVKAKDSEGQNGAKGEVSREIHAAKEQAKKTWDEAMKQVKEPGRMHRLERYAVSQLPAHPQYLDAGTLYSAELQEPLDFGSKPLTPSMVASIGTAPPEGSVVHARLVTPLTSATAEPGDPVEAVLWQPLFDGDRLIYPAGSRLTGTVLQARPAHKPHQNGQLRFVFHQFAPVDGPELKVNAILIGVEAAKADHVELDAEGGAEVTSPPTRYLSTGLTIALAAASAGSDGDAHDIGAGNAGGNASNRMAGGVGGFKLVGLALGAFVHSQPLGLAMGALGAGRSIYVNFVRRGQDLVFPKNTAMEISVGIRPEHAPAEQKVSANVPKS